MSSPFPLLHYVQVEHSQLHTENASLLSELSTVSEKLNTVQKCYRQAEQENMHLAEDLREMERERDKLYEEKMKLQVHSYDVQAVYIHSLHSMKWSATTSVNTLEFVYK